MKINIDVLKQLQKRVKTDIIKYKTGKNSEFFKTIDKSKIINTLKVLLVT